MCSWFPVLDKFCFRFDLRTGLYAIAALRTFLWFVFMIVAVANYASRVPVAEEEVTRDEILASNITDVFTMATETADEAGEMHQVPAENVDKGEIQRDTSGCSRGLADIKTKVEVY